MGMKEEPSIREVLESPAVSPPPLAETPTRAKHDPEPPRRSSDRPLTTADMAAWPSEPPAPGPGVAEQTEADQLRGPETATDPLPGPTKGEAPSGTRPVALFPDADAAAFRQRWIDVQ